ncbi:MAG: DUF4332 domain-containing protein [Cyanobacteria bacterium NC_groundwater_1444_Ag_S-0.65um_54_12]|nr:DUF4332 domain-containing protein [Cyanobacteria bacterium NC_groundwater_1444_Ag_S-0.65um_54_12]
MFDPIGNSKTIAYTLNRTPKVVSSHELSPSPQQEIPASAVNDSAALYRIIPNQQHVYKLIGRGMGTPSKLLFWNAGPIRRFFSSLFTGIPAPLLRMYAHQADLLRVPGMQADWARLLFEVGIRNPSELEQYAGNGIGSKIQRGALYGILTAKAIELAATEGRSYSPPSLEDLVQIASYSRGVGKKVS